MSPPTTTPAAGISAADFSWIQDFVRRESAIRIDEGKEYLVVSRLGPVAAAHDISDLGQLVERVRAQPRGRLSVDVIDALTINETSFFRDVHPFRTLVTDVLPELMRANATTRRMRIWCAAASSGQEPYSVAMAIHEHLPALLGWDLQILATDISRAVLARAAHGEFSHLDVNRGLPASMLVKHFHRQGARWRISDDIRRMVRFEHTNLIGPWAAPRGTDVVLLRNVLIYFDDATRNDILHRMRQTLVPGGYLGLGGTETTVGAPTDYDRVTLGRSVWFRTLQEPPL